MPISSALLLLSLVTHGYSHAPGPVPGPRPPPCRRAVQPSASESAGAAGALSEDAVAAKLRRLRGRGRGRGAPRRPAPPAHSVSSGAGASGLPGALPASVPVWAVPESLRLPGAAAVESHGRHVSLDALFPGSGLADAWDERASLRTAVRQALRDDLMAPLLRGVGGPKRACALSLGTACMVSWSNALAAHAEGKVDFSRFTAAFAEHGVRLSGEAFIRSLGELCGAMPHGSLIDIIPLDRRVAHSWHQDSGLPRDTVLLGFPPRDGYEGGGVFSHCVQLSHPLRPSAGDEHGAVVEYERLSDPPPDRIDDAFVLRPLYSKGREVWVSNDAHHLHSTPDRQLREAVWRFM